MNHSVDEDLYITQCLTRSTSQKQKLNDNKKSFIKRYDVEEVRFALSEDAEQPWTRF
jgi:hypothetical protein